MYAWHQGAGVQLHTILAAAQAAAPQAKTAQARALAQALSQGAGAR